MNKLSQDYLKKLMSYDPDTGKFVRVETRSQNAMKGREAGWITDHGYRRVSIDRKSYYAHRLAWLYVYGEWPEDQIDHINHIRIDNRISNLRITDQKDNMRNASRSKSNVSGVTGVSFSREKKKWYAQIMVGGSHIHLGYFPNKQLAIDARESANEKYGFHENHGKVHSDANK